MRLMQRDESIIDFIKNIGVVETNVISELFFNGSLRSCQKRLTLLYECGYIKRTRKDIYSSYIYYLGKQKKQMDHNLYLSHLYLQLIKRDYEILKYKGATKLNNVICDGIFIIRKKDGAIFILLLEIEKQLQPITLQKYCKLYSNKDAFTALGFPIAPKVLLLSNKQNISTKDLNYELIISRLDFEDFPF